MERELSREEMLIHMCNEYETRIASLERILMKIDVYEEHIERLENMLRNQAQQLHALKGERNG